jgi:hypothetical protein
MHKLDALTRILEAEPFDAMIVFARTKLATEELAEKLQARGFAAAAINGDIAAAAARAHHPAAQGRQARHPGGHRRGRARAGRGAHQPRAELRHPYDTESYVHRIGRTGRAGRRARRSCSSPRASAACCARSSAPRASRSSQMDLPSVDAVNERRVAKFLDSDRGRAGQRRPVRLPRPGRTLRARAERAGGGDRRRAGAAGAGRDAAADIRDDHTYIDLPRGMPDDILQHLQSVWVAGQRLRIKRHSGELPPAPKIKRDFGPGARFERHAGKPPHKRKPRGE